jgi:dTDP-4-dehydrorhamnose 3,5-epimerase
VSFLDQLLRRDAAELHSESRRRRGLDGVHSLRMLLGRGRRAATDGQAGRERAVIFSETKLGGAFVIDLDRKEDDRGFFARAFCQHEFEEHGLKPVIVQANVAFNRRRGTIRGMHFQFPPAAETKLVRCTRGAILDIIVDLRPESATYLDHVSVELTADNGRALYVPERFAHGYQVLEDGTETSYQVGEFYAPEAEGGLRYDDPLLALSWPLPLTEISDKDRAWKSLAEVEDELQQRMALQTASGS